MHRTAFATRLRVTQLAAIALVAVTRAVAVTLAVDVTQSVDATPAAVACVAADMTVSGLGIDCWAIRLAQNRAWSNTGS